MRISLIDLLRGCASQVRFIHASGVTLVMKNTTIYNRENKRRGVSLYQLCVDVVFFGAD